MSGNNLTAQFPETTPFATINNFVKDLALDPILMINEGEDGLKIHILPYMASPPVCYKGTEIAHGLYIDLRVTKQNGSRTSFDCKWVFFNNSLAPTCPAAIKKIIATEEKRTDARGTIIYRDEMRSLKPVEMTFPELTADILQTLHDHVPESVQPTFAAHIEERYGVKIEVYEPCNDKALREALSLTSQSPGE